MYIDKHWSSELYLIEYYGVSRALRAHVIEQNAEAKVLAFRVLQISKLSTYQLRKSQVDKPKSEQLILHYNTIIYED